MNQKNTAMLKIRNKAASTAKKADTLTLDNPNILILILSLSRHVREDICTGG
ncbi:MAG: hypothetical protein II455_06920 [Paludibacteraceae bacterium]|nr:hypothetical protein [Paludibacteraceae bacterium]